MRVKLTIKDCEEYATSRGGKVLSQTYIDTSVPMEWECAEGHVWKNNFGKMRSQSQWCKKCTLKEKTIFIPEDELRKLIEDHTHHDEIAKYFKVSPSTISLRLREYGIKTISGKIELDNTTINKIFELYNQGFNREEISKDLDVTVHGVRKYLEDEKYASIIFNRHALMHEKRSIPLTYEQEQLILGSLLGDAYLGKRKSLHNASYDFSVGHCLAQKEYVEFKSKILNSSVLESIKGTGSYSAGSLFYMTSYHNKYELQKIYNICSRDGVKTVTKEWVDKLDLPAIAYWFMDDGSSTWSGHNKRNDKTVTVGVKFSTLSFGLEEINLLRDRLSNFCIDTTIVKHSDGKQMIISVKQNSVNLFMRLIEPFMVDCMKYKIKYKSLK